MTGEPGSGSLLSYKKEKGIRNNEEKYLRRPGKNPGEILPEDDRLPEKNRDDGHP
jgi:hypothetical protein